MSGVIGLAIPFDRIAMWAEIAGLDADGFALLVDVVAILDGEYAERQHAILALANQGKKR